MRKENIIWQIQEGDTGIWFNVSEDTYDYCDNDIDRCREIFGEVKVMQLFQANCPYWCMDECAKDYQCSMQEKRRI